MHKRIQFYSALIQSFFEWALVFMNKSYYLTSLKFLRKTSTCSSAIKVQFFSGSRMYDKTTYASSRFRTQQSLVTHMHSQFCGLSKSPRTSDAPPADTCGTAAKTLVGRQRDNPYEALTIVTLYLGFYGMRFVPKFIKTVRTTRGHVSARLTFCEFPDMS